MPFSIGIGIGLTNGGGVNALGPIANRTFIPTDDGGSGNPWVLAETQHILFEDMAQKQIEIWWPNWRASTGLGSVIGGGAEVVPGATATATAQITYYDAVTNQPVVVNLNDKTGGTTALTAASGANFKAVATINALRGSRIFARIRGNFPNGMVWSNWRADIANGDLFQFGASVPSLTTTPTNSFAANLAWYGPCLILGPTTRETAAIVGDSREALGAVSGADVANDLYGNAGQVARLIGKRMAYVNVAIAGETAADFAVASQSQRRRDIVAAANPRRLFVALGTNDIIFNGRTPAQALANMQSIASDFGRAPILKTIDPATTGDINTPTRPANESLRISYNTTVRSSLPVWASGSYDPAITLESSGTPGAWASASYVSPDFTHETSTGNEAAITGSGFDYTKIGSPAVLTLISPPVAAAYDSANKASNVTLSGFNLIAAAPASTTPWPVVRTNKSASSGKYIFAVRPTSFTNSMEVGFVNASFPINVTAASTSKITDSTNSFGINGTGGYGANGAFPGGVNAMVVNTWTYVCVDFTAGLVWFKTGAGNWNNNVSADPATGVGGKSFSYSGQTFYPAVTAYGSTVEINFGATAYGITTPSGYNNFT